MLNIPLERLIAQKMIVCSYQLLTASIQSLGASDTTQQPSQRGLSASAYLTYSFEKLDPQPQRLLQYHAVNV